MAKIGKDGDEFGKYDDINDVLYYANVDVHVESGKDDDEFGKYDDMNGSDEYDEDENYHEPEYDTLLDWRSDAIAILGKLHALRYIAGEFLCVNQEFGTVVASNCLHHLPNDMGDDYWSEEASTYEGVLETMKVCIPFCSEPMMIHRCEAEDAIKDLFMSMRGGLQQVKKMIGNVFGPVEQMPLLEFAERFEICDE